MWRKLQMTKVTIETHNNGFVVVYDDKDGESTYVYKATEDLMMIQDVAKRYLKRRIRAVEQ